MSSKTLTQQQKDALEAMVDSTDLDAVLNALDEICHAKASHLRENWNEETAAKVWERNGRTIGASVRKLV